MFRPAAFASLALAAVSLPAPRAAAQSPEAPVLPAVHAAMQKSVDDREVAGSVTLVADGDRVVHLDAVGKADLAAGRAMAPDDLLWIA